MLSNKANCCLHRSGLSPCLVSTSAIPLHRHSVLGGPLKPAPSPLLQPKQGCGLRLVACPASSAAGRQDGDPHKPNKMERAPEEGDFVPGWAKFVAIFAGLVALSYILPPFINFLTGVATGSYELSSSMLREVLTSRTDSLLNFFGKLNVACKVAFVLVAGLPFIIFFATVYHCMTGTPMQPSLIKFYVLINRLPGMSVLNEKTFSAALLVNFVYYIGMFTFAIFLGVVTEEVKGTFKNIRNGVFPVRQSNHTVILNWNEYTPLVLQALAAGKHAGSTDPFYLRPVSVLANKTKAEMDLVAKTLNMEIHTRKGNPIVAKDLKMVSAHQAASILVMQPDVNGGGEVEGQAQVAAAAMAVASLPGGPRVVLQSQSEEMVQGDICGGFLGNAASECGASLKPKGGSVNVLKLSREDFAERFITLTALQPGLVKIYSEILSPVGAHLVNLRLHESLVGKTYQECRRMYGKVLNCGYIRGGQVNLLPSEGEVMQAGDRLVSLSRTHTAPDDVDLKCATLYTDAAASLKPVESSYRPRAQNILVIGLNSSSAAGLSQSFGEFAPKGSSATFLLPIREEGIKLPGQSRNCKSSVKFAPDNNPASVKLLLDAGIRDADTILICGLDHLPAAQADAFVMGTFLQIQQAVKSSGRGDAPHVVATVRSQNTSTAIHDFLASYRQVTPAEETGKLISQPDMVQSDHLVSSILALSARSQDYVDVIQHLLDNSKGAEMYLRNPELYSIPPCCITFAELVEKVRLYNESALGYRTHDGKLVLAPEPHEVVTLEAGAKIVVFAEDNAMRSKAKSA